MYVPDDLPERIAGDAQCHPEQQVALAAGFLDRVVAPDQLMAAALDVAQQMKKLNPAAHRHTKLKARKALLEALDSAIVTDGRTSVVG